MSGAARIKGALFVVFAIFLLSARDGAAAPTATVMVGEVAGYGDYTLQAGFYETFRDILEESLIVSQVHADLVRFRRRRTRRSFLWSTWTRLPVAISIDGKWRGRR